MNILLVPGVVYSSFPPSPFCCFGSTSILVGSADFGSCLLDGLLCLLFFCCCSACYYWFAFLVVLVLFIMFLFLFFLLAVPVIVCFFVFLFDVFLQTYLLL